MAWESRTPLSASDGSRVNVARSLGRTRAEDARDFKGHYCSQDCGTFFAVAAHNELQHSGAGRCFVKEDFMISREQVQDALDLIRPALQADGGDVELDRKSVV